MSDNSFQNGKLKYEKPQLVCIGTLESITQHASTGHALDSGFTSGTLATDLTFSDINK